MLGKNLQEFIDKYGYTATPIPIGTKDCKRGGFIISSPERELFKIHRFHNHWCWSVEDLAYPKNNRMYTQVGNIISVIRVLVKTESF